MKITRITTRALRLRGLIRPRLRIVEIYAFVVSTIFAGI